MLTRDQFDIQEKIKCIVRSCSSFHTNTMRENCSKISVRKNTKNDTFLIVFKRCDQVKFRALQFRKWYGNLFDDGRTAMWEIEIVTIFSAANLNVRLSGCSSSSSVVHLAEEIVTPS